MNIVQARRHIVTTLRAHAISNDVNAIGTIIANVWRVGPDAFSWDCTMRTDEEEVQFSQSVLRAALNGATSCEIRVR